MEREYPKVLLNEVDLGRAGLTGRDAVETLPPADFVISGGMDDVSRVYEPNKPWEVKLDLSLRLRGHVSQVTQTSRSDAIEAAADEIMGKIEEFRRQPTSRTAVPEKELWRRQALYLMPRSCETWAKAIVPNFYSSNEVAKREAIRTWENVLLLDDKDPEAMTYLGVCLIAFNRWSWNASDLTPAQKQAAAAQCIAGSQLVERAMRMQHDEVRADTYIACIGALKEPAPARAKEMAQYVVDHRGEFRWPDHYWVKSALATPQPRAFGDINTPRTDWDIKALMADWNRVIQNAEKDPESVVLGFMQRPGDREFPTEQAAVFLAQHLDSSNPVVQFVAQRAVGEQLCRKGDAAGLQHFDKAIEVLEKAYALCSRSSFFLDNIYQRRIEGCQLLGLKEEAKQTALSGARHFMEVARFDASVAWLYQYCVTNVLGAGQEKESLAICDTYLAALEKKSYEGREPWTAMATKREQLVAHLAGKPVPGLGGLLLIKGTELVGPLNGPRRWMSLAATEGKLWLVSGNSFAIGNGLLYRHASGEVSRLLPDMPSGLVCVAATRDAVFFGGQMGLYKLDTNGTLLKHYDKKSTALPGDGIMALCEGGGKIYFSFQGSPHQGVAVLDPASDEVSVLAPSGREAQQAAEPLVNTFRLRWDAATPRLYACCYQYWHTLFPMLTNEYSWTPQDKKWQPYPINEAPRLVVSQGDETIVVRAAGEKSVFQFVKTGQQVTAAVPLPPTMGEPAWDDARIWAPTASGLYEVDRATGNVRWLAYQEGNPFFSVLRAEGRLFIATAYGLYCYGTP